MSQSGESPVTTIALSIKHVLDKFRESLPQLKFVYDETLTYETAVAKFRRDNNLSNTSSLPFPLLAIRRSVLRFPQEGMSRRSVTHRGSQVVGDTAITYKFIFAEFDLEFLFLHNQTFETEVFEINYLSELGISSGHEIEIEIPEIGVWKNFCHFTELQNKEFNDISNFFQSVAGSVIIKGTFLILDARHAGASVIKEINTSIKDLNTQVLYTEFKIE